MVQQEGGSWPQMSFPPTISSWNERKGFSQRIWKSASMKRKFFLLLKRPEKLPKHQEKPESSVWKLTCDTTVVPGTGELGMTCGCAGTCAAVWGGSGNRGWPWVCAEAWVCPPVITAGCWGADVPLATVVLNTFWALVVATDTYQYFTFKTR